MRPYINHRAPLLRSAPLRPSLGPNSLSPALTLPLLLRLPHSVSSLHTPSALLPNSSPTPPPRAQGRVLTCHTTPKSLLSPASHSRLLCPHAAIRKPKGLAQLASCFKRQLSCLPLSKAAKTRPKETFRDLHLKAGAMQRGGLCCPSGCSAIWRDIGCSERRKVRVGVVAVERKEG